MEPAGQSIILRHRRTIQERRLDRLPGHPPKQRPLSDQTKPDPSSHLRRGHNARPYRPRRARPQHPTQRLLAPGSRIRQPEESLAKPPSPTDDSTRPTHIRRSLRRHRPKKVPAPGQPQATLKERLLMPTVNLRSEHYDVYIGRPGPWGNPFIINSRRNRAQVLEMYSKWLLRQIRSGNISLHQLALLDGARVGMLLQAPAMPRGPAGRRGHHGRVVPSKRSPTSRPRPVLPGTSTRPRPADTLIIRNT